MIFRNTEISKLITWSTLHLGFQHDKLTKAFHEQFTLNRIHEKTEFILPLEMRVINSHWQDKPIDVFVWHIMARSLEDRVKLLKQYGFLKN